MVVASVVLRLLGMTPRGCKGNFQIPLAPLPSEMNRRVVKLPNVLILVLNAPTGNFSHCFDEASPGIHIFRYFGDLGLLRTHLMFSHWDEKAHSFFL